MRDRLSARQYRMCNDLLNLFCRADLKLTTVKKRVFQRFRCHKHHFACVVVRHRLTVKLLGFLAVHKIPALLPVAAGRRFPNIYNSHIRLFDEFIVSRYFFACKAVCSTVRIAEQAVTRIHFLVRRKVSCGIVRDRLRHLFPRRAHRRLASCSFRQAARCAQLCICVLKGAHDVALIGGIVINAALISLCELRADSARRAEHQTAERAARSALSELCKAELRVRVCGSEVGNVVQEVRSTLLSGLRAHLPQNVLYRVRAAGVQDFGHPFERQLFGCRLDDARDRAPAERLARAFALLIQLKSTLTGRLRAHHERSERRTHDRNRACGHRRSIRSKRDRLFGHPARRRRETGLGVCLCLVRLAQDLLRPKVLINALRDLERVLLLTHALKLVVNLLIVRRNSAVLVLTLHVLELKLELLLLLLEPREGLVFLVFALVRDGLLHRVDEGRNRGLEALADRSQTLTEPV